jgi:exonuclease VII small subunit
MQRRTEINLEEAQLNLQKATINLQQSIEEYGAGSIEAQQASIDLENAQLDLIEAQKEYARRNDISTDASLKLQVAQKGLTDANQLGTQKTQELAAASEELQKKQDNVNITQNQVDIATRKLNQALDNQKWMYVDMGVQIGQLALSIPSFIIILQNLGIGFGGVTAAGGVASAALGGAETGAIAAGAAAGGLTVAMTALTVAIIAVPFVAKSQEMFAAAKAYDSFSGAVDTTTASLVDLDEQMRATTGMGGTRQTTVEPNKMPELGNFNPETGLFDKITETPEKKGWWATWWSEGLAGVIKKFGETKKEADITYKSIIDWNNVTISKLNETGFMLASSTPGSFPIVYSLIQADKQWAIFSVNAINYNSTMNASINSIGKGWNDMSTTASSAWEAIKTKASSILESIKSWASDKIKGIQDLWGALSSNTKNAWDTISKSAGDSINSILNNLKNIPTKITTIHEIAETKTGLTPQPAKQYDIPTALNKFNINPEEHFDWNVSGWKMDYEKGWETMPLITINNIAEAIETPQEGLAILKALQSKATEWEITGDMAGQAGKFQEGVDWWEKYWKSSWNYPQQDFISRPGQQPVSFSSDDTIIGMKNQRGSKEIIINIDNVYGINERQISQALYERFKESINT